MWSGPVRDDDGEPFVEKTSSCLAKNLNPPGCQPPRNRELKEVHVRAAQSCLIQPTRLKFGALNNRHALISGRSVQRPASRTSNGHSPDIVRHNEGAGQLVRVCPARRGFALRCRLRDIRDVDAFAASQAIGLRDRPACGYERADLARASAAAGALSTLSAVAVQKG